MNVIGTEQDIPLFAFQTETAAIFVTDVTAFGCAGVRAVL